MSRHTSWSTYSRVMREARAYWLHIGGLLVLSLLSTPLSLLAPLPLAIAVDSVLGNVPVPGFLAALLPAAVIGSDQALLAVAASLMVVLALLSRLRTFTKGILKTYTGERIVLDLRARLLSQAQRLSLTYHDAKGTADSTYRIHNDATAVKSIATSGLIPFVSAAVQLVATLVVVAQIDLHLAAVALVLVPALFLLLRANVQRLRGGWQGVKELDSSIMSGVQEVLGGIRVVKAFGQEERERERYVRRGYEKLQARMRLSVVENSLGTGIGLIVACGSAAVLYIGTNDVRAGLLTVGQLLLVMSYLSQLYAPLESIADRIGSVQSTLVGAERALRLLDLPSDVPERPNALPLRRARGAVVFDQVWFAYGDGQPVLRELSLAVPAGARVGLVGPTGAGKTTLVSLLTRFFDPTKGRILLDGIDLRDYKVADLRTQFAIVLQEPVLFSNSIADNIAYARPGASFGEIQAAAKAANVHNFVVGLPDGYQTTVGERGMRLSGGERQRISLARAFLKDAPILILDEPTSSVDTGTEAVIMEAVEELARGRTVFMIAHRLSTLDYCDLRIEIHQGRLVETSDSRR